MPHEAISVFDMFKIGVGPSSSHTLGPWKAALACVQSMEKYGGKTNVEAVTILLYGSLAKTGVGHGTDIAIMLGLCGEDPETINVDSIAKNIGAIQLTKTLGLGANLINFNVAENIQFLFTESLPFHPNGLTFLVTMKNGGNNGVKHIFQLAAGS